MNTVKAKPIQNQEPASKSDAPIGSIYTKFLLSLIPAVTFSAILLIILYAYVKTNATEDSLIEKLNFIFVSHQESIAHPLWTLDMPGLDRAMKTIAIYPEIQCVEVLDISDNTKYSWPTVCSVPSSDENQVTNPITYQNKTIGTLYLSYTNEPAMAQLLRELVIGATFSLLLVLITCIAAFASLRSIIGLPLSQLMKSIRTAEKVESPVAVEWSSQDEFGEVIKAYNKLIAQVNNKTEELVSAREQAELATESKGRFLANMSHELRSPLTTVISITEMLREEAEDEKKDTEAFNRVAGSGRHLLGLIDDILQYSKIEANMVEVSLGNLELSSLMNDVAATAQVLAQRRNNTFTTNFSSQADSIVSDELRLRQIIFNLLDNACKFTENGHITFSISDANIDHQEGVLFSVKDTGIGISEENQNRIFEEFAQADASTTRHFGGTGLGLSISQRLCNLLGGNITLVSTEGEGTEFSFVLPVTP